MKSPPRTPRSRWTLWRMASRSTVIAFGRASAATSTTGSDTNREPSAHAQRDGRSVPPCTSPVRIPKKPLETPSLAALRWQRGAGPPATRVPPQSIDLSARPAAPPRPAPSRPDVGRPDKEDLADRTAFEARHGRPTWPPVDASRPAEILAAPREPLYRTAIRGRGTVPRRQTRTPHGIAILRTLEEEHMGNVLSRRWTTRAAASLAVISLIAAGCGTATTSSAPSAAASTAASAAAPSAAASGAAASAEHRRPRRAPPPKRRARRHPPRRRRSRA